MMKGFPGGTSGKEPTAEAGDIRDTGSIPGLGRPPGVSLAQTCLLPPPRPPPGLSQLGLWPQYLLNEGSSYCGKGQGRSVSDRGRSKCKGPGAGVVFLEGQAQPGQGDRPPPQPQGGSQVHHHLSTSLPVLLTSCQGSLEQEPRMWATSVSLAGPRAVEGRERGCGGQKEHGQHRPAAKARALALILS